MTSDARSDFETRFEEALSEVPDDQFDRERFVPGAGPTDADVMLVGEAPGAQEVEDGRPFVGNAGRRLDSVLEDIGVDRDRLYVTNVVKARPEDNSTPRRPALDAWWPVFEAELEAVDPDLVVTLGNTATRQVLSTDEGITALRGQRIEHQGRTVVPTYHPAATFYDESKRGVLEEDLRTALTGTGDRDRPGSTG